MTFLPTPFLTLAQDNTPSNLFDALKNGGPLMIVIGALSIVTIFLVAYYLLTIRRGSVVSDRFMTQAESMIRQHDFHGLLNYCDRSYQSISYVTEKSVDFLTRNPRCTVEEVREVASAEGSRQVGILHQRINYLADIGTIAPMLGLLGTVIGMIKSFADISQGAQESVKSFELSAGVSEALTTTASGLAVGIVATIFYSVFRGRVQKYVSELEAATTHLMALISAQADGRVDAAVSTSSPAPMPSHGAKVDDRI